MKKTPLLGAVIVVVAGLAAGCGGTGYGSKHKTASTAAGSASSGSMKTVTISETEYKLTPSTVTLASPGTYRFKVVNKGTITHALEVEGTGVHSESSHVGPGQSTTFTVDLKGAGTFEMYCPIDGHRSQGMEGKITIGSAGAGSAGTTNGTSTTGTRTQTSTGPRGY